MLILIFIEIFLCSLSGDSQASLVDPSDVEAVYQKNRIRYISDKSMSCGTKCLVYGSFSLVVLLMFGFIIFGKYIREYLDSK